MCLPKSQGGERCNGTPLGKGLYKLYVERKAAEPGSDEFNRVQGEIDRLKEAGAFYGPYTAPHTLELSKGVESILASLKNVGNPLVVGGCIRDSFLGADNKDIDIEVHGTTVDKLISQLRKDGFQVDEVGKQFGVLKASKPGVVSDIDVSVPRRENNVGAGHRGFEVSMDEKMTIEEAGARRDFTFNAISYDHERKVIVDPYGGAKHFQKKVLHHVSPAFAEDPLRVLRAFQFAGRFGLKTDNETSAMCKSLRGEYSTISKERVIEEWEKFYGKSIDPIKGVKALQDTGWDDTIPGMKESLKSEKTVKALGKLPEIKNHDKAVLGSSVIAMGISNKKQSEEFIQSTVLGTKRQQLAMTLSQFNPKGVTNTYEVKNAARQLRVSGFTFETYEAQCKMTGDVEGLRVCAMAKESGVLHSFERPMIQGRDILESSGAKPGAWMGKVLAEIEDRQYRGEFKNKDDALKEALTLIPR